MDKDLKKLLNWLYSHRKEWLNITQLMESGIAVDPFMLEWLVKNDLLTEVTPNNGDTLYRISLGGMTKLADFKRKTFVEYASLIISIAAVVVSIAAFFRP